MITSIYPTQQHPDYGVFVKNIQKSYEANGHQVTLVAFNRIGGKLNRIKEMIRFYRRITIALDHQSEFDLINLQYPYLAVIPIVRKLKYVRIPLIVSVHGSDVFPDRLSKRLLIRSTSRLLEQCQRIIVPSLFFKRKMMKAYRFSTELIKVAPPGGYDGAIFYPRELPESTEGMESSLDHSMESPVQPEKMVHRMGFAARLVEGKGWKVLLDAFARIAGQETLPSFHLIMAGSGPDELKIRNYANELGIGSKVTLTGALEPKQLGDFYRSLDFFVVPTLLEESLGMVGIEALACGIPVISSAIGGGLEYMSDGVNGRLLPPGDVEQLCGAILEMTQLSKEERLLRSQAAYQSALPYERQNVARRLEEILTEELS